MSHRFGSEQGHGSFKNMLISLIGFIIIIGLFIFGLSRVSSGNDDRAAETLSLAISRNVARCYTLEGSYPESLSYLKEHYGLSYDETRFTIDYQPLGRNIMPDITIIDREAKP